MLRYAANSLVAVVVLVTPLAAQLGPSGLPVLMPTAPPPTASRAWYAPAERRGRLFPQTVILGSPFWAEGDSAQYAAVPPLIVVQTQPAGGVAAAREETEPAPALMIEWQGDRYVRRNGLEGTPSARGVPPDYVAEAKLKPAAPGSNSRPELPPTLFIFRDGHREESSDYSIISGAIYARGDYWTTGSWSKKILIANLDVPATLRANQERGVHFRLPSAPNEVVTRP
jgi:hypothetical protein